MNENEYKSNSKVLISMFFTFFLLVCIGVVAVGESIKKNSYNSTMARVEAENDNKLESENVVEKTNQEMYSVVLDEYKEALSPTLAINYMYVNENYMDNYKKLKGTEFEFDLEYAFYDINNDGIDELIINRDIVDIFSYDGNDIIRLFKEEASCLAETRCNIEIYEDGTIYLTGTAGADYKYLEFYAINKDIKLNKLGLYLAVYNENKTLTIYDSDSYNYLAETGTKAIYQTIDGILEYHLKGTKKVNLNNLEWVKIN